MGLNPSIFFVKVSLCLKMVNCKQWFKGIDFMEFLKDLKVLSKIRMKVMYQMMAYHINRQCLRFNVVKLEKK